MDPKHTDDLLKHLEKQNDLLKEAHKTMSQELQTLMVEEQMMMDKLCEVMVIHRNKKKTEKTRNVLEAQETAEASSTSTLTTGDEELTADQGRTRIGQRLEEKTAFFDTEI